MSLYFKRFLGRLAGLKRSRSSRRVILLYHALGACAPAVTIAQFKAQMQWLARHAQVVSLDTLLTRPLPSDQPRQHRLLVSITFDDGYASLKDEVAKVLADAGFTATVFLSVAHISSSVRQLSQPENGHYPDQHFLSWEDVQHLSKAGWQVGSHGNAHIDLTDVSETIAIQELLSSKAAITNRLQQPCEHFAFTWGRFTPQLQKLVQQAGYRSAASGLHGPLQQSSDIYALPRMDIRAEYNLEDFAAVVTGRWDWLGIKQRLMRHRR